jgi:Xaa-Pro aminopeptidase
MEAVVGKIPVAKISPLAPLVQQLRAFKSEAEQKIMKRAGDITGKAHAEVSRKGSHLHPLARLLTKTVEFCR